MLLFSKGFQTFYRARGASRKTFSRGGSRGLGGIRFQRISWKNSGRSRAFEAILKTKVQMQTREE